MYIKGLDISHHEGSVNWKKLVNENHNSDKINFVIFKCTEGATHFDNSSNHNAINALAYKIQIGYYHFAFPQKKLNDAKLEAEFFIQKLKGLPKPNYKYPYTLDIEVNPEQMTKLEYLSWIKEFIDTFKKFSNEPLMIYGSPNFLNSVLPENHNLHSNPLWIAHYGTTTPRLPKGWSNWKLWQKTDKGIVSGIDSYVDINYAK